LKEYCYALPINDKFRRHCNLENSSSYEHIRRVVERQRDGIQVEAEAVVLDAMQLPAVCDTDAEAVSEQSQRSHWHQIGDGNSAPIVDGSPPVLFCRCFSNNYFHSHLSGRIVLNPHAEVFFSIRNQCSLLNPCFFSLQCSIRCYPPQSDDHNLNPMPHPTSSF
jgi:hypothetical protein